MRWSAFKSGNRQRINTKAPPMMATSAKTKYQPMFVETKAWIDERMPLRVRNVPKIDSAKAPEIRQMFQTLSMPLRSCTITECKKAVATSHGISAAFSTGSQAQKPPHPTSV